MSFLPLDTRMRRLLGRLDARVPVAGKGAVWGMWKGWFGKREACAVPVKTLSAEPQHGGGRCARIGIDHSDIFTIRHQAGYVNAQRQRELTHCYGFRLLFKIMETMVTIYMRYSGKRLLLFALSFNALQVVQYYGKLQTSHVHAIIKERGGCYLFIPPSVLLPAHPPSIGAALRVVLQAFWPSAGIADLESIVTRLGVL